MRLPSAAAASSSAAVQAPGRVLSIQSHVVHGYVGNKAAVFPLQLLGFEVDAINSVQFSNNTGYPSWQGSVASGEQLLELLEGLEANQLLAGYSHLLTGYIGSVSLLRTVVQVVERLRQHNPELLYVCDPVMGDEGKLYCLPELPPAFAADIVPIASVLTPNQFEAELLSGIKIQSEADGLRACALLHERGPHTVVISSMDLPGAQEFVTVLASTTRAQQGGGSGARLRLRVPRVEGYFTGTGDLFTALLLGWMHRYPDNLKAALELAVAGLQAVLRDTAACAGSLAASRSAERSAAVSRARELRLIPNQRHVAEPVVELRADVLD